MTKKSKIGLWGRLKCLKTIKGKTPDDGINFVIVDETRDYYKIILPSVDNLVMQIKKKDFTII